MAKLDGTNGLIQQYDYQVLTTGFSYTFASGTQTLIINPAGTLATGTITMPAAPADGMVIWITTTKQIVALTVNGNTGQTLTSGVTSLAPNQSVAYLYRSSNTTWYPFETQMAQGNGPAFSATMNANQTVSLSTATKLQFNTELFDTNNNYDPTTNYRFTPTVAGYYQINAGAYASASTITQLNFFIYKNGSTNTSSITRWASVSDVVGNVSNLIYMNGSTDYLEIYGQIYGSGTATFSTSSNANWFSGVLVRTA